MPVDTQFDVFSLDVLHIPRIMNTIVIITPLQRSWKGVFWFHLVCLSVCLSVDRIVSALYLQQYSSNPFHFLHILSSNFKSVACKACFKIKNFWQILQICNFDFVFFWPPIWYDSIVWVIMRRRGVSSECRHSNCSSWFKFHWNLSPGA